MGLSFESLVAGALTAVVGQDEINAFIINSLVEKARTRPHPWSTRYPYICWSGLTDRTYDARLLPAFPYPEADAPKTRRPPIQDVVQLFEEPTGRQRECPKSTCLFPAFAQYLTDGFIRTRVSNPSPFHTFDDDRKRTTSNHEIDLSPLYGRTEAQTHVLRVQGPASGQKGRLKSQLINGEEFPLYLFDENGDLDPQFADANGAAVLDWPLGLKADAAGRSTIFAVGGDRANANPQVAMINTLFLREHNRLAGLLEKRFGAWDDERIFQTARNIVIVMFIKIVVEEYINHINTSVFKFIANPQVAWHAKWNRPNWMTAEFGLLYRWHSLIPENFVLDGKTVNGMSLVLNNSLLINAGLANTFVDISANNATELGLQNSPSFLWQVEKNSVDQARTNNISTFNAYREAMSLDPVSSFEELVGESDDDQENARRRQLAKRLEDLYGDIDSLEFYVGLFAEPRVKNGPLPELLMAMVAMDAFSQALTNPLLSEHVYGDPANRELAFTDLGLKEIQATACLRDILVRNSSGLDDRFVGMTRQDWRRE